jgi:polar amino acid transport system substrate-binding protein
MCYVNRTTLRATDSLHFLQKRATTAHGERARQVRLTTARRADNVASIDEYGKKGMGKMIDTWLTRRGLFYLAGAGAALGAFGLGRPALAARTLADVKKAGELRIGCEAAYVPLTYRDDKGQIVGYDVDLFNIMVKPLGVKATFIDTQWSGVIPALYAGRFDLITTLSYTKERMERVLFSNPYADASQALLIRLADKDKIKTIDDLSNMVLGIKLGSPGETMQKPLDEQLKAKRGAGFKGVKTYDDHPAAYLALAQGSVDGVLNTVPTLAQVLKDRPGRYSIVYNVGRDNWHGFGFRKEDTELCNYINQQIDAAKKSGEIYALQDKWFGFRMNLADKPPVFS